MIVTTDIQSFKILKEKLGETEAEALVEFVDAKLKETNNSNLKVLATKEDIQNLKTLIAENKAETIRWMFLFWIGQIAVTFGYIILYLKK